MQSLAGLYGFVFAECNPGNVETPQAIMRAAPGARVADIQVQVDAQVAGGGFRDKDLVALLAGANDIIELYQQFPGRSEDDLLAEVGQRGQLLAQQVNRLVEYGAKVIISTVPDMGLTPYALKQRLEFSRQRRPRRAAVAPDDGLQRTAGREHPARRPLRRPGAGRPAHAGDGEVAGQLRAGNVTTAVCVETAVLPDCTDQTLVEAGRCGRPGMWADDLRLAYGGQSQIGNLAVDRARRNPF